MAQRRKTVGLSQERLAEIVGVDRSTVVRWERADTDPQPWHRPRLAAALKVSTEDLADLLAGGQAVDTGEVGGRDRDGDVQRRGLLAMTATSAIGGSLAAGLVSVLVSSSGSVPHIVRRPVFADLARAVATAKDNYQACRYDRLLGALVTLLPAIDHVRATCNDAGRAPLDALAADVYHVAGSVLLKLGDQPMALVAAERSTRCAAASEDPVAAATSARIMTHALMSNGHTHHAVNLSQAAARELHRATRLRDAAAVAAYGALLLRGAIAAAQVADRDAAQAMLDQAARAGTALGHDGNDRWTGFGPTNVLQHRVHIALTLGDAGTAITYARQVPPDKITLAERRASLFIDIAQAYTQWGRHAQALTAFQAAQKIAPEEIGARPSVHRIIGDLAASSRGRLRTKVADFATAAGVRL